MKKEELAWKKENWPKNKTKYTQAHTRHSIIFYFFCQFSFFYAKASFAQTAREYRTGLEDFHSEYPEQTFKWDILEIKYQRWNLDNYILWNGFDQPIKRTTSLQYENMVLSSQDVQTRVQKFRPFQMETSSQKNIKRRPTIERLRLRLITMNDEFEGKNSHIHSVRASWQGFKKKKQLIRQTL